MRLEQVNFKELKKADFRKEISEMILDLQDLGPLFLIFHDCRQDIKYVANAFCASSKVN